MICKKRGPLGACLETAVRTQENDNDKALKYFKDPSAEVKKRQERALIQAADDSEGNALIQKLRQQSLDNKVSSTGIGDVLLTNGAMYDTFAMGLNNQLACTVVTRSETMTLLEPRL